METKIWDNSFSREDVETLMADASALAFDNLIDAVFSGQAASAA